MSGQTGQRHERNGACTGVSQLTTTTSSNWFVVRTKPHQETRALQHLLNQDFEAFLPRLNSTRRFGPRSISSRQALFPGYLFVRFDVNSPGWRSINSTMGVLHLIMADGRPLPVPSGLVESFIQLTQPDGCVDLGPALRPGQEVRLVSGPFSGLAGQLAGIDGHMRARVLLQIMGRHVELETPARVLVPA